MRGKDIKKRGKAPLKLPLTYGYEASIIKLNGKRMLSAITTNNFHIPSLASVS
jgi:hypothetical protein